MKAIKADNLTKMFGHLVAVDHISFEVEEWEIFGFLGTDGAGQDKHHHDAGYGAKSQLWHSYSMRL